MQSWACLTVSGDSLFMRIANADIELAALNLNLMIKKATFDTTNNDSKLKMATTIVMTREKSLAMNFLIATSREKFQPLFDKLEMIIPWGGIITLI